MVALALVLVVLVVFLILLILVVFLIFVLVLLLLLLLEVLDQFFDDIPVLLGLAVHRIGLDDGLVVLEGILPIGELGVVFLGSLTGTDKGVGQVVGGGITDLRLGRGHRLREVSGCLLEIARLVGSSACVEFHLGNRLAGLEPLFKILQRPLVISLLVIIQSGGMQRDAGQQKREHRGGGRHLRGATPLTQHGTQRQQKKRGGNRPGIALDRFAPGEGSSHLFLEREDSLVENCLGRILTVGKIKSACSLCNLGQARHVELGIHRITAFVADKIIATLLRPDRDQRSGSGTESDCENPYPSSFGLFGCLDSTLLEIVAVGHEHQGTGRPLTLAESRNRHPDRGGDIGPPLGNRIGVEIADRVEHRSLVHGQRGLKKGRAGKGDKPDTVAPKQVEQILGDKLGAAETVWRGIGRQHAAGDIDGQNHVTSLGHDGFLAVSIARFGQ